MVLMQHSIQAIFDDGSTESHVSSLDVRGSDQHSAMSQTVGYTAAAAVQLVLSSLHDASVLPERGLLLPTKPAIYQPILDSVAQHGIRFEEGVHRHPHRNPLLAEQRA